jgi:hypothetical protein
MDLVDKKVFSDIESVLRGKTGKDLDIGIITAENEMGKRLPDSINNQRNERLYRELSEVAGARVYRIAGNFEGIDENSFLVTGVSLSQLKELASRYKQQAFIYGDGINDNMTFHYMEVMEDGQYKSQQIRRTFVYKLNADENYSLYKGVKFVIPFFDDSYVDKRWDDLTEEERGVLPPNKQDDDGVEKSKSIDRISSLLNSVRGKDELHKSENVNIGRIKELVESLRIEEKQVKIKVKESGVLEVPEGKKFWQVPFKHYTELVDRKGYAKIIKALNNLKVWNKDDDIKVSNHADSIMDKLKKKYRPEE